MKAKKRIKIALGIIMDNGGVDGGHHKQWALDQVVRALTDCPIIDIKTVDYSGKPHSFKGYGESKEYIEWQRQYSDGEEGPATYGNWEKGIAP